MTLSASNAASKVSEKSQMILATSAFPWASANAMSLSPGSG